MKKIHIVIYTFIAIIIIAIILYFFSSVIAKIFNFNQDKETNTVIIKEVDDADRPRTKAEERELLTDLLPDNPVDTQEEIDEQVKLLEQLQNLPARDSQLDALQQLQGPVDIAAQEKLLEELTQ